MSGTGTGDTIVGNTARGSAAARGTDAAADDSLPPRENVSAGSQRSTQDESRTAPAQARGDVLARANGLRDRGTGGLTVAGARLKQFALTVDDGQLMRMAFYGLLATALVFVLVDWRTIASEAASVSDPAGPMSEPVLPPALTTGEPDDAPGEVLSDPETLKQAIRFELQPGGILLAKGAIDPGAATRFAAEIEARGEYVKVVQLDSPGGSVGDALAMSTLIRERQLDTTVEKGALCASSCPIVLSGGVERSVAEGAVVGVHQVFNGSREKLTPEMAMSEAQRTTATVTRHLDAMGIKPGLWQRAMETPPDRLAYLTAKDMRTFGLTTAGDAEGVQGKARPRTK